jgi:hypothetical protein
MNVSTLKHDALVAAETGGQMRACCVFYSVCFRKSGRERVKELHRDTDYHRNILKIKQIRERGALFLFFLNPPNYLFKNSVNLNRGWSFKSSTNYIFKNSVNFKQSLLI